MAMMMTMYVGYFSLANHLPKSIEKNSPFAAEQTARVQFNSPGFKWAAAQLHNGTEILKCMACFSNFYAISGGFDGEVLRFCGAVGEDFGIGKSAILDSVHRHFTLLVPSSATLGRFNKFSKTKYVIL